MRSADPFTVRQTPDGEPDSGSAWVIDASGLSKRYRHVNAVTEAAVTVGHGEVFGLIGPDGAGKTSVLQILAGVLRADGGRATVAGIDVVRHPEAVKSLIGYMPQGLGLNLSDALTVHENVEFFRELRRVPLDRYRGNREELLEMTRLAPFLDRPAGKLSGGMRQKLALICTLIHLPDVLLLDEPTTGVDPISRRDFWTIIHSLVATRGVTVLLTTSYMDEAERCHRIGLMHEGRVIAEGAPETLTAGGRTSLESVFVRHVTRERRPAAMPSLGVLVSTRPELRADELTGRAEAVDVHHLTCRFGAFTAVDDVTLHIEPGEILGLLGPNGAGKTTLIKTLCGLQPPTSGSAVVGGLDVVTARRALRARVGYMSQRFSLYRDQTVLENLELSAGLYGLRRTERRARIATLLATLDLEALAGRLPLGLPLGIRQRLALACAIIHDPHVLFLDEPTAGVDPLARRHFWEIVHFLAREGGVTVLVSTHYMDEAVHCDRLGLMHQGKLVALGAPDELRRSAEATGGRMVTVDVAQFARAFLLLRPRFPDAMLYGRRIRWQSREAERDRRAVEALLGDAGLDAAVEIGPLSIEDTFVSVLRGAGPGRG